MTAERDGWEFDFAGAEEVRTLSARAAGHRGDLTLVDIIADYPDRYIFVAIAPPPDAGADARRSSALCETLARAYRDSVFFNLFGGAAPKPAEYAVFYPDDSIDGILVAALSDELKRRIPLSHSSWGTDSALSCSILTPARWLRRFGPCSLRRAAE